MHNPEGAGPSETTEHVDLLIIGSGSGNSVITDDMAGWKIVLIERSRFGGTCLNAGCIPSKMLVYPADVITLAAEARRLGVDLSLDAVRFGEIRDRIFGRIDPIAEGGRTWRAGLPNVTLIQDDARMVGPRTFAAGGRTFSADRVVLAAGASPVTPSIDGLDRVRFHTTETIMRIDSLPRRLAILGSGFIAAEMGHVFSAFGSQVTVIGRSHVLLRAAEDGEIAQRFTDAFADRVHLRVEPQIDRIEEVTADNGETEIVIHTPKGTIVADALLVATGRRPNGAQLGVDRFGVELDADGYVRCDDALRTTAEGVWALGDIRNPLQLKHLANQDAAVLRHNLVHPDQPMSIHQTVVPHGVFSHPQIGSVGATEEHLKANGVDYVVGRRGYDGVAFGWAMEDTVGFAKVLVDPATELILGAHVLGLQAASLIQPLVQAMQFGTTARQLATEMIWPHPALTEVIENALLDALEAIANR